MKLKTRLLIFMALIFAVFFTVQEVEHYYHIRASVAANVMREASDIRGVLMATRRVYHRQFLDSEVPLNEKTVGLLPAFTIPLISRDFNNRSGSELYFNNVSDTPRNPTNMADPMELEAIDYFRENPAEEFRFVPFQAVDGREFFHYSTPMWTERYCLNCHGEREDAPAAIRDNYEAGFGYKEGDLRGLMSIKIPAGLIARETWEHAITDFWVHAVAFSVLLYIITWVLRRYVSDPIERLNRGLMEVSSGLYDKPVEGLDGELKEISETFHSMARRLAEREKALEAAKNEAQAASTAKTDFIATMSHEIRNPVSIITGLNEALEDTDLTEEQRKYVDITASASESLLSVVDDILDLSKVESGMVELDEAPFDLIDFVEKQAALIGVQAEDKGLDVNLIVDAGVPKGVVGDKERLREILTNLLGNAVKFTEKGSVTVEVSIDKDYSGDGSGGGDGRGVVSVLFCVLDTGPGIPDEERDKVFDRYIQVSPRTARKLGGSGLGLAISKRLVELMGGRIWLESSTECGCCFCFTARLGVHKGPIQNKDIKADVNGAATGPLKILLAEDSKHVRFVITTFLKDTPYKIDVAGDGEEAVEKFKKDDYDLVLMDMEMPVKDGYEATREIRAFEEAEGRGLTPIVALTGHALRRGKRRSLEAGCTAHLTKPLKKQVLLRAIREFSLMK